MDISILKTSLGRNNPDDGSKILTIFMKSDGHEETLVIPEEMRELVVYEGWDKFVSFEPAFRRGEGVERVVNLRYQEM